MVYGCRSLAWRMRTPRKPERHALSGDDRKNCCLPASHGQPGAFVKHLFAEWISYTSFRTVERSIHLRLNPRWHVGHW